RRETVKKLFSTLSLGLIVLTIFTLTACGGSGSSSSAGSTPSASSGPLTIAFLPKQSNHPSFDTAASRGKLAATSVSGQVQQLGRSEVELLAKPINSTGQIAILSAASTAANQNTWIGYMKDELAKKYPNMQLVKIAYGNDDDQTSFNDTLALLQQYPNLKGII